MVTLGSSVGVDSQERNTTYPRPGFLLMIRRGVGVAVAAVVLVALWGGYALIKSPASSAHPLFGVAEPLSTVVGNDLRASEVVPMQCIPSRADPVGVFLGLQIVDWDITAEAVLVDVRVNHALLGSHPSGCSDPFVVLQDSMFLLGPDDEAVHAQPIAVDGDTATLAFDLAGRMSDRWSVVFLPTIDYKLANGERQTSIFGLVGHYALR